MHTHFKSTHKTTINASLDKVWDALTNPAIVKQYFFGSNLETDWQPGNSIQFSGEYEGTPYADKGIVLEYEPNSKLAYSYLSSWSGKEDLPENYLWVSYEVRQVDNVVEVSITQSNYDEEKAAHTAEGWGSIIEEMRKLVE